MSLDNITNPELQQAPNPNHFLNIPEPIAQHPGLKPFKSAKLIYGILKMHAPGKNRCRLKWRTLAREADLNRATVARSLNKLEELHLIQRIQVIQDGEQRANHYLILPLPNEEVLVPHATPPSHSATPSIKRQVEDIKNKQTANKEEVKPEPPVAPTKVEPVVVEPSPKIKEIKKPKKTTANKAYQLSEAFETSAGLALLERLEDFEKPFKLTKHTRHLLNQYLEAKGFDMLQRAVALAQGKDKPAGYLHKILQEEIDIEEAPSEEPSVSDTMRNLREEHEQQAEKKAEEEQEEVSNLGALGRDEEGQVLKTTLEALEFEFSDNHKRHLHRYCREHGRDTFQLLVADAQEKQDPSRYISETITGLPVEEAGEEDIQRRMVKVQAQRQEAEERQQAEAAAKRATAKKWLEERRAKLREGEKAEK